MNHLEYVQDYHDDLIKELNNLIFDRAAIARSLEILDGNHEILKIRLAECEKLLRGMRALTETRAAQERPLNGLSKDSNAAKVLELLAVSPMTSREILDTLNLTNPLLKMNSLTGTLGYLQTRKDIKSERGYHFINGTPAP